MLEALSREAWALTGRALPGYRRHETPACRRALGDLAD